jgi:hypothetical protein
MDNLAITANATSTWIAELRASVAEIERGEQVPMQPALDRMQMAIDRIEKQQAGADHRNA